jgi:hypothetical protein
MRWYVAITCGVALMAASPAMAATSVALCISEVVVRPTALSGESWDAGGVPAAAAGVFASAGDRAALVTPLLGIAGSSLSNPDIAATVRVEDGSAPQMVKLNPAQHDSFVSVWQAQCPQFSRIRVDRNTRVTISFVDQDLSADDPIGVVSFGKRELRRAARHRGVFSVPLVDTPQIAYFGIRVTRL